MGRNLSVWSAAIAAIASTIGVSTVQVVLASRIDEGGAYHTLRALFYAGFSLGLASLGCLCYYLILFAQVAVKGRIIWADPSAGIGFNAVALITGAIALIWLACKSPEIERTEQNLCYAGLAIWAIAATSQCMCFMLLRQRLHKLLKQLSARTGMTKYGITLAPNQEVAIGTRPSFCSRETTLASSRPCTPASSRTYSLHSSTTKVASSFRSKLTRTSARSSLEIPPFPAGEATALGSAFDRYNTSNIIQDVRATVLTPTNRSGLEPIPGSRPGTPEEDSSPMLPSSPISRQHPSSPEIRRTSPRTNEPRSPVSSPPNFSRPTSRAKDSYLSSPTPVRQPRPSVSMTDLIHPLFRPDSPAPPQILTSNTMVTASPLANQPITPKTLSRLRSASDLQTKRNIRDMPAGPIALTSKGQWRVMPPAEDVSARPRSRSHSSTMINQRPSIADSESGASVKLQKTSSIGSPGPSIIEEDELPPILPGFVLSAGSRSSLVGYGKRKGTRRISAHLD